MRACVYMPRNDSRHNFDRRAVVFALDQGSMIRLFLLLITKTCLYKFDPLKPHIYIVKLGFTGVYIIFLISAQKHRMWVLVRTASPIIDNTSTNAFERSDVNVPGFKSILLARFKCCRKCKKKKKKKKKKKNCCLARTYDPLLNQ